VTVTVPAATPFATYFLLACADDGAAVAESLESNNCRAATSTVVVSKPDLTVTAVSNPPGQAQPGAVFTVTDAVLNIGGASAGASTTRYYMSANTVRDTGDLLMKGTRAIPALAPSASSTASVSVTIPTTTPLGIYYLVACADDLSKVVESDDANNCRPSATAVNVTRPDLITSIAANPPTQIAAGRSFVVSDTAVNQGTVSATASSTRYYLSTDTSRDSSDILLIGARSVAALAPEATSTASRSVSVPGTTPSGAYHLLACADDTSKIVELDESNNCASSTGTVQVLYPDLVEIAVSYPPPATTVGGTFTVTDTVQNQGAIATSSTATRYYLSADTVKDASDVMLAGSRSVAGVAVGGSSAGSRLVTVPAMAAGVYFMFACADDANAAVESNEANNCLVAAAPTTIGP
jgi:subtilase family serine protease